MYDSAMGRGAKISLLAVMVVAVATIISSHEERYVCSFRLADEASNRVFLHNMPENTAKKMEQILAGNIGKTEGLSDHAHEALVYKVYTIASLWCAYEEERKHVTDNVLKKECFTKNPEGSFEDMRRVKGLVGSPDKDIRSLREAVDYIRLSRNSGGLL